MKQDRRLNGWIVISSIIGTLASIILLACGAVGILGFFYTSKLAKVKDLQFFVNQKFFTQFKLDTKYLYLYIGIALAVIGILILILSIILLNYANKYKVVRRKGKIFIFGLFDLAIASCSSVYLILEFKNLPNNIKYVLYGLIGVFGFIWLCKMLGIIFGRSEKFMSNDNNKFAFAGNARTIRVGGNAQQPPITPNGTQQPAYVPQNEQERPVQQQSAQMQQRPMQSTGQARPQNMGQNNVRPMQQPMGQNSANQQRNQNYVQPSTMPRQNQPSAMSNQSNNRTNVMPNQQNARPVQPMARPNNSNLPQNPRPVQPNSNLASNQPNVRPVQQNTSNSVRKFCPKCGKMLTPQERICSICGAKITE